MITRRASCCCGNLSALCSGDPLRVSMCHCFACQARTGSAFGVQARFLREQVQMEGTPSRYARTGDAGATATYQFCGACGSTLCWENDAVPGMIFIAVGAFADLTLPTPTFSVYEARKHPWVVVPPDAEHMD